MSGKMKKLICALLASTMLVSSIGLVGFAAETETAAAETTAVEVAAEATEAPAEEAAAETEATTEEATEATEAPAEEAAEATEAPAEEAVEATEAPVVATEAPAATSSKYDDDTYYQKALSLCQALGIITGYEDGSVKPESTVTRAEMAAIILRMLATSGSSTYQNIFTDVAGSHWAASVIQTASVLGIVNGMGDGTFVPDGNVQYEQVAKMIVCAMNFGETAEYYGGYPSGYLKVASDMDITKNAAGTTGVAAERGVVIKMVYNALLADYNEPNGTEYGQPVFKAERSLAEYAFDVKEENGILLGTSTTSLTNKELLPGQALIMVDDEEAMIYNTELTGLDDLLASNVTFFYQDEDNGDSRKLLAIVENSSKTETVTLSNEDIVDIETFTGFDGTKGEIKIYGSKRYKIADDIQVVYNGSIVNEATFTTMAGKASVNDTRFYTAAGDAKTYAEFLQPTVGTIKLVENNSDSEGYDIIFVDSYETMVVSSATAKKVIGKIGGADATIDVDEEKNDLTIKTTIEGMEAAPRNLKKNNVVSVKRSLDGETLEFTVTGESVTGSIKSLSTSDGKTFVTVNNKEYEVDVNAVSDCKTGSQAIFYLDAFNRIGYIESATADGMLQAGESYGWIMSAYESEDGEDTIISLYTQDGKAVEAKLGSSLDYWAPKATSSERITDEEVMKSTIMTLVKNNSFVQMGTTPIRLIKYKLNSSNELSRIYCAVDASTVTDESALRINPTNLNGRAALNGSVMGYNVVDGILQFNVPMDAAEMKSASSFSVEEVVAGSYVVRENGSSRNFILGEFSDSINANILINFTASASKKAEFSDMNSAEGGPSVMVVDTIAEGYDEDNDIEIYSISGYVGGSAVSITTNKNTNFGDAKNPIWGGTSNRYFQATELWNAEGASCQISSLTDPEKGLKKGDILLYTTDGKLLLRYASASAAKFDDEGNFIPSSITSIGANNYSNSTSRVHYYFDQVLEHELSDVAWVKLKNITDNITFDPSVAIDVVTIGKNGKVEIEKETATISEIEDNNDYLFVYIADKGSSMKSMVAYRIEE